MCVTEALVGGIYIDAMRVERIARVFIGFNCLLACTNKLDVGHQGPDSVERESKCAFWS